MNQEALRNIGLTEGEIKVYLALLRIGEAKKTELSSKSRVSSSKIYEVCEKLQNKGLVGIIIKDGVKYFRAMQPKRILDFFNERANQFEKQKQEIEKIIPELESQLKAEETQAVLFKGFKAIKNIYLNILEDLKQGEEYFVIGVNYGENSSGIKEFFENFHRQRVGKKIKVNMLVNADSRENLVKTIFKYSEIKYLPQYLMNNMIVLFYKNKSFIFFLAKESVALMIENKEVTNGFRAYFNAFWKLAKK